MAAAAIKNNQLIAINQRLFNRFA